MAAHGGTSANSAFWPNQPKPSTTSQKESLHFNVGDSVTRKIIDTNPYPHNLKIRASIHDKLLFELPITADHSYKTSLLSDSN